MRSLRPLLGLLALWPLAAMPAAAQTASEFSEQILISFDKMGTGRCTIRATVTNSAPRAIERLEAIWYALGPDAETRLRQYAYDYMRIFGEDVGKWAASSVTLFTPEALRAAVENVVDAGADELFLVPTSADPDELARTNDALGL